LYGNKTSIVAFGRRSRKLWQNENVTFFCPAPPTRCGTTDTEAVLTVHDTKRCVSRRPRGRAKFMCVICTCTFHRNMTKYNPWDELVSKLLARDRFARFTILKRVFTRTFQRPHRARRNQRLHSHRCSTRSSSENVVVPVVVWINSYWTVFVIIKSTPVIAFWCLNCNQTVIRATSFKNWFRKIVISPSSQRKPEPQGKRCDCSNRARVKQMETDTAISVGCSMWSFPEECKIFSSSSRGLYSANHFKSARIIGIWVMQLYWK